MIDLEGDLFGDLYYKLPKELRASKHEEVGTIIFVNEQEKKVGSYLGGGKAYRYEWTITIVNFIEGSLVDQQTFLGSQPPDEIYCRKESVCEGRGDKPVTQAVDYLISLPRK